MTNRRRVFIFGAGFSFPAGMPLATDLIPLLLKKAPDDHDMHEWLDGLRERLEWMNGGLNSCSNGGNKLNIEEVFHYGHFDIESFRLRQHVMPVGRNDGPGTASNQAESIESCLQQMEVDLRDIILECDNSSDLSTIERWAEHVSPHDSVLTFNYDTLAERALTKVGKRWSHGLQEAADDAIPVFKLHGSIDWMVAGRTESFSKLDLIFDKPNANRDGSLTGHNEEDKRLWRCRDRAQLVRWIQGRDIQITNSDADFRTVGIAGLGAYKQVHRIPGLGLAWVNAMRALHNADDIITVGFSLSDFDKLAQIQFAEVARSRFNKRSPLPVLVVDPCADKVMASRFASVFRSITIVRKEHQEFDWVGLK